MTTKISSDNIQTATLESIGRGPTISNVQVTNSSFVVVNDTAVSTAGGYIKITGANFASGVQVYVGSALATSVAFVSSTVINVQVPARVAGSYDLYVINNDGSFGIKLNGITFNPVDVTWVTNSTLTTQATGVPISIQLSATGAIGYQLQTGSNLPTGLTLSTNGLLSGTITVLNDTTYGFTIEAYDAELQDSPRTFSLTVSLAAAPTSIDYLVVAGGGGGGDRHGGGGGAGGYRAFTAASVATGTSYAITIGAGGVAGNYESGGLSPAGSGGRGVDSSLIGGSISTTSNGGGGAGTYNGNPTGTFGSGGGGGGNSLAGIAGTAGQGNSGGSGSNPGGGGGGGAGAVGGNASTAGSGGVGLQWLDGNYYAGGGGGGWQAAGGPATPGGNGGGGTGAWDDATITAGSPNTGGGGGGSRSNSTASTGRAGGSGVVIIRYPDTYTAAISTTGNPTITVSGGYRVYKFTSSGTIVF